MGADVLLGEVRVLVSWLHGGEEAGQDGVVTLRRRHCDDIDKNFSIIKPGRRVLTILCSFGHSEKNDKEN